MTKKGLVLEIRWCFSASSGYSYFRFMKVRKFGKMFFVDGRGEYRQSKECMKAMETKAGQRSGIKLKGMTLCDKFLLLRNYAECFFVFIGVRNMRGRKRICVVSDGRVRVTWSCFSYIPLSLPLVQQARSREQVARYPPRLPLGGVQYSYFVKYLLAQRVLGVYIVLGNWS